MDKLRAIVIAAAILVGALILTFPGRFDHTVTGIAVTGFLSAAALSEFLESRDGPDDDN